MAGCSQITSSSSSREFERGRTSLRPLLDVDALGIPGTGRDDIEAALGDPTAATSRRPPENQRPGTVTTMTYDGLEIVVRELRKPSRSFISDVVLTSGEYAPPLPVRVGARRSDIERVLGEPSETEGDEAVYPLTNSGDRCIVTYDGTRAARVAFQYD